MQIEKSTDALPETQIHFTVLNETDRVRARALTREMARQLGFHLADQVRFVTAVSELVKNAIQHAGGGLLQIFDESNTNWSRLRVVVEDCGPGIANVERLLASDFVGDSSRLGLGLPGVKRLVTEFHIRSAPGKTHIEIVLAKLRHKV